MMENSPFTLYKLCDYGLGDYQPPQDTKSPELPTFNLCPTRPNDNHPAEIFHQYLNNSKLSVYYTYKIDSFGIGYWIWNMLYNEDIFTRVPRDDFRSVLEEQITKSYQKRDCYKTSSIDLQSLFDGCFNFIACGRLSASQILCHRFFRDEDLCEQLKNICRRFPGKCYDLEDLIARGSLSDHFQTIIDDADESPMPPIGPYSPPKNTSHKLSGLLPNQITHTIDDVLASGTSGSVLCKLEL